MLSLLFFISLCVRVVSSACCSVAASRSLRCYHNRMPYRKSHDTLPVTVYGHLVKQTLRKISCRASNRLPMAFQFSTTSIRTSRPPSRGADVLTARSRRWLDHVDICQASHCSMANSLYALKLLN